MAKEFEVYLVRKATTNDAQNTRKRIEYVKADSPQQAGAIALAMPQNAAFRVQATRESAR